MCLGQSRGASIEIQEGREKYGVRECDVTGQSQGRRNHQVVPIHSSSPSLNQRNPDNLADRPSGQISSKESIPYSDLILVFTTKTRMGEEGRVAPLVHCPTHCPTVLLPELTKVISDEAVRLHLALNPKVCWHCSMFMPSLPSQEQLWTSWPPWETWGCSRTFWYLHIQQIIQTKRHVICHCVTLSSI